MKPSCRIVSSDYLDRDVALNVRGFYAAAGFRLQGPDDPAADLLVVLRGDNGSADRRFAGDIHVYDYVREYSVNWTQRYPAARSITLINLDAGPGRCDPRLHHVRAYLPVIPELWTCRLRKRRRPGAVHVSNYKRMPGDAFQEQLLALIQAGFVEVYGGRWDQVGVRARPLSYRQANLRIAAAASCFGLMWPYQRGRTLSGRMWQAPLNGCVVFSEPGSDPLGCPGVICCERFDAATAARPFAEEHGRALAEEAARFWRAHTAELARQLGFEPAPQASASLIRELRRQLLWWDLEFRLQQQRQAAAGLLHWLLRPLRSGLAGSARALGIHPRQLRERRRGGGR